MTWEGAVDADLCVAFHRRLPRCWRRRRLLASRHLLLGCAPHGTRSSFPSVPNFTATRSRISRHRLRRIWPLPHHVSRLVWQRCLSSTAEPSPRRVIAPTSRSPPATISHRGAWRTPRPLRRSHLGEGAVITAGLAPLPAKGIREERIGEGNPRALP